MPNANYCLRPVFTERIIQLLQRGRSINLIGAEGTGRKRLLEDIQKSNLTYPEIRNELMSSPLPINTDDAKLLVAVIHAHEKEQYHFLEYLRNQLLSQRDSALSFEKRLKKWSEHLIG